MVYGVIHPHTALFQEISVSQTAMVVTRGKVVRVYYIERSCCHLIIDCLVKILKNCISSGLNNIYSKKLILYSMGLPPIEGNPIMCTI